jgi:hypothetical protein
MVTFLIPRQRIAARNILRGRLRVSYQRVPGNERYQIAVPREDG